MSRLKVFTALIFTATSWLVPGIALSASDAASDALARSIIEQATADLVADALQDDGPIVGMAPVEDMLIARMDVWMNPVYWENYVREALFSMNFQLPWPLDPVKPEAFLPNVPVPNGDYVSALPTAPMDLSQISYAWNGWTKTVEDYLYSTEADVLNFAVNGVLVDELYANGYAPDVRHQPWSVTKTFVAATVGIALAEGRFTSLQDPIDQYIADLTGTPWQGVTIENILQMESGVHWDEGTPILVINTQVEQWVQAALDYYTDGALGQTRNEFLAALPAAYEQGSEFRYNSGNTQVLAWLLETLYDRPFNQILAEKLWQPMGAHGDAMMISDRVGDVIASQGLYARPYDFVRFGELLRNGGVTPEGARVIPAAWVAAMISMTDVSGGAYGLQTWAAETAGPGAYKASGFEGQKIAVVPDKCVTAVRLGHTLGGDLRQGDDPTDPAAYGFAVEMGGIEFETMLAAVADVIGGCSNKLSARQAGGQAGGTPGWAFLLALAMLGLSRRRA